MQADNNIQRWWNASRQQYSEVVERRQTAIFRGGGTQADNNIQRWWNAGRQQYSEGVEHRQTTIFRGGGTQADSNIQRWWNGIPPLQLGCTALDSIDGV